MHGPLKPLLNLSWRLQSWSLERFLLKIPSALVPDRPLPADINIGVGGDFYDVVREGQAVAKRAEIVSFADDRMVELDTGEALEADVVIFGTGWRQHLTFLDDDLRNLVQQQGFFHLFRHILPPKEPRLGFIGYATTFMTAIIDEISAHWLSQHFRGELNLPSQDEMDQHIAHVRQWAKASSPVADEGFFLGPFTAHYIDELMRDMNLRVYRTGNPISEYFGRFLPSRYKDVGEERRQARKQSTLSI
jgi:cation diffusion facilitator CzcD-associated flavoprotein CzcO